MHNVIYSSHHVVGASLSLSKLDRQEVIIELMSPSHSISVIHKVTSGFGVNKTAWKSLHRQRIWDRFNFIAQWQRAHLIVDPETNLGGDLGIESQVPI